MLSGDAACTTRFFLMNTSTPPHKRVVSRNIVRKRDKVGEIRAVHSDEAKTDAMNSMEVRETSRTRTYVRPRTRTTSEAPRPSAPPVDADVDDRPRTRTTAERTWIDDFRDAEFISWSVGSFVVMLLIVVATVACGRYIAQPAHATLARVERERVGVVEAPRNVTDEGWAVPDGAWQRAVEERQRTTCTVVDGEEEHCHTDMVTREVLSHYEARPTQVQAGWRVVDEEFVRYNYLCNRVQVGWTEEIEFYLWTEEVCYDDGTCEDYDVYELEESEPIYDEECEQVPVYEPVREPVYHTVVEEVPVLVSETRPVTTCHTEPITHEKPVYAPWYTYEHTVWDTVRTLRCDPTVEGEASCLVMKPGDHPPGARFKTLTWHAYLTFAGRSGRVEVPHADAKSYEAQVGKVIRIP